MWTVEPSAIPGLFDVYDENGDRVVRHTTHDRARLIASAPDLAAENERLRAALEALAEKWESKPYTGDYTKAAYSVAASKLRAALYAEEEAA